MKALLREVSPPGFRFINRLSHLTWSHHIYNTEQKTLIAEAHFPLQLSELESNTCCKSAKKTGAWLKDGREMGTDEGRERLGEIREMKEIRFAVEVWWMPGINRDTWIILTLKLFVSVLFSFKEHWCVLSAFSAVWFWTLWWRYVWSDKTHRPVSKCLPKTMTKWKVTISMLTHPVRRVGVTWEQQPGDLTNWH